MPTNRVYLIVCVVLLSACAHHPDEAGYTKWLHDPGNGLRSVREVNGLVLDLQYLPSEYVWFQRNGSSDKTAFTNSRGELDPIRYFTLEMRSTVAGDFIEAGSDQGLTKKKAYYFAYQFQDCLSLTGSQGYEAPCVLYHFEKNSKVNNTYTIVIGFENNAAFDKDFSLKIRSPEIAATDIDIEIENNSDSLFEL